MSFWPFGQNLNHSNINKILDEYFHVLHELERINPSVGKAIPAIFNNVQQRGTSDSLDSIPEEYSHGDEVKTARGDQKSRFEKDDQQELYEKEEEERSMNSSESSTTSFSSGSTSKTDLDEEDISNATAPMMVTTKNLDNSFIERMLVETELLNELSRQNKTLLDFICFGFFFDKKTNKKVNNMEYLVDQLMECISKIKTATTVDLNNLIDYQEQQQLDDSSQEDIYVESDTEQEEEKEDDNNSNNKKRRKRGSSSFGNDDINNNDDDDDANEDDESAYLTKATIISEIFSLDIWLISESLVKNQSYLNKIWSIINQPNFNSENSPLVPIFLKINQNLLLTRQDQYLNFIRTERSFVDDMLKHVDISLLMDFFLKIISTDKIESPTGIIELVYDQNLISKCLNFLNNKESPADIQACVGDFLKALIAISANAPLDDISIGPNSLTRQLASPESIAKLVDIMINQRGAALNTTVSIVIELIRKNNSDYDQVNLLTTTIKTHPPSNRDPIYLGYLLRKFSNHLSDFFQIILDIENDANIPLHENQLHEKFKPLGFERFKVVELIAELLHCSNMGLMNSKRAERIARRRDKVRSQLSHHLQDALNDLSIEEKEQLKTKHSPTRDTDHDLKNNNGKIDNDNNDNDDESDYGDEIDESFEIPYINMKQNIKLRTDPTVGDLFKIKLYDTRIVSKIMELFLTHPWNNFWHNVIFDIIQQIFNGRMDFSYNSFLVLSLFNLKSSYQFMTDIVISDEKGTDVSRFSPVIRDPNFDFKITTDFILRGYQDSYKFYELRKMNLGYMGHIVLIAEEVVKFSKLYKVELISPDIQVILQTEEWQYYSEEVLNETRMMYSKILGGGSYIDDGNGNIIPQLPDNTTVLTPNGDASNNNEILDSDTGSSNGTSGGGQLINVESLEEQLSLSTESDLHNKLREMLINRAQEDVDNKNTENGVFILGPPEDKNSNSNINNTNHNNNNNSNNNDNNDNNDNDNDNTRNYNEDADNDNDYDHE
ncbi:CEI_1a_G0017320.mRNA.1.CDS.1 [Saccharomyces cerevisiae]|nr:EM14S01-3B_G0049900.mRNA.1.CDS.1 [Saccharomyces cerevisiae]CAI4443798.1 AMH_1a_G0017370.mRNA.1.CDS.1 [Saccharomyces cerevisiae]CAI4451686.1 CEI_1a_G0017320.mRNA.1.CDS.1 [Saccharomyces cerevisiae]CAI6646767.1 AMH_1a_G0017370.mRNA.1.CDS.1 [Saccharomyces cerevisiae]CAI7278496.1 CEI_1a_G0017320.mRNA.1.CDS.1 [Saccharomyces cerevisiae]